MNGPEPGLEIVPGLRLVRRLGRGGMGEAWLAHDAERDEQVVAKLLPADSPPERLALLRREARLVRKLQHPRIVPVYGFRAGERYSAVVLPYLAGGDASARRGASVAEVVRVARDVADALAYLHELGVVHRDVKLTNVLFDAAREAHLADFGIASVAQGDEEGVALHGGGSHASMSPQQRAGLPARPADDLYSLGVLIHELLAGEPPSAASGAPAELPRHLAAPQRLRRLVAALLAEAEAGRPASAAAVRGELDAILAAETGAADGPRPGSVRLQPPPRVPDSRGASAGLERLAAGRPIGARGGGWLTWPAVLLGGLVLLAAVAVVWLPQLAERSGPQASAPVAEPSAHPSPTSPVAEARAAAAPSAEAAPVASPGRSGPKPVAERREPLDAPARRAATEPPPPLVADEGPPAERAEPLPEPTPDRQAEAQALATHRERGALLESREEWRGALREYEAALAIDPHLSFALAGRQRAEKRARLDAALDFHLQRSERLSATAVAREAEGLLEQARGIEPMGPALQARVAALERALEHARTPVAVVIESDGLTELTLSRVGPLGTLTRRSLELMPGRYTVTGSRRGYRDVRREFVVAAGAPGPTVSLRCEDAL